MPRKPVSIIERFWTKVVRGSAPDDCWGWTAATHEFGYGLLGTGRRGRLTQARITYDQADSMRRLYAGGMSQIDIGWLFGCDSTNVSCITRGLTRRRAA